MLVCALLISLLIVLQQFNDAKERLLTTIAGFVATIDSMALPYIVDIKVGSSICPTCSCSVLWAVLFLSSASLPNMDCAHPMWPFSMIEAVLILLQKACVSVFSRTKSASVQAASFEPLIKVGGRRLEAYGL
jgi:hypothetical protein